MGPLHKSGWRCVCALVGGGILFSAISAAEPDKRAALTPVPGLLRFDAPQGVTYSALILPAPAAPNFANGAHDHVLIVDTSASQSGVFRSRALTLANAFCRELPVGDRVQLIAADVSCSNLTEQFTASGSPALAAAFERLEDRVPLGSTNVELALRTALETFSGDHARSVLYIGDGFSTAKLIQSAPMFKLLDDLRTARVPVNSFAVGPRTDLILLGALAQHTGGIVMIDEPQLVADRQATAGALGVAGKDLARAAVAPVFYPRTLVTEPKIPQLSSMLLPPVRFDRETVLLGKDLKADQIRVEFTGSLNGQPQSYSWLLKNDIVTDSSSFLATIWTMSDSSQGLAMPLAGRHLVDRARQAFAAQLDLLAKAGVRSLENHETKQVEDIARVLQDLDPSNLDAPQLLKASHRVPLKPIKAQLRLAQSDAAPSPGTEEPEARPLLGEETPEPAAPLPDSTEAPAAASVEPAPAAQDVANPRADSLLDDLQAKRKVREEQITVDVNLAIEAAKRGASDSFADAYDLMKRQLDTVVAATDISADVRLALRRRLETAIQQLQNQSESFEQKRAALDRRLSQQEAMKKLMDQTQRDEEKMEQLIDRVRALLARGYKGNPQAFEDAEAVSRVAVELDPYLGVPNLDVFNSEAAGHLDKSRRLRDERQDKLLATLYQVELSHVPFPDEPPVVWPSPERWQWITENRRKWKSVDLKTYSKKEEKIVRELEKPTTFDFTDESLDGIRDTIMERHGFDIVIDKVKLEEESVATDATDITLKVNEISLKNALKLLLDPKNLTYAIENEVLKITTKTEGIAKRPLRVYNVGDLVMPINPLFGRGGSRTGGQTGGGGQLNGGGGGMSGGMGGGSMGGGGMGGGMGGGGFF